MSDRKVSLEKGGGIAQSISRARVVEEIGGEEIAYYEP
jgi:hypothetical protein